jgi:hypothetical protein
VETGAEHSRVCWTAKRPFAEKPGDDHLAVRDRAAENHRGRGEIHSVGKNASADAHQYLASVVARDLLRAHRETYRTFWRWSDQVVDHAMLTGSIYTTFGWTLHVGAGSNPRSLRNFPMQANGAEMLRLACCLATERGIEVCAPVHDAVLIAARIDRIEADVVTMQDIMCEASRVVLAGFGLGSDAKIVRYPDRYSDKRGAGMWAEVVRLVGEAETETASVA